MKTTRYIVHVRTGCAAIVDTFWPIKSPGIDSKSIGVVDAIFLPKVITESHIGLIDGLKTKCNELNKKNTVTQSQANKVFDDLQMVEYKMKELFPNVTRVEVC